jgi:DNA replication ATP-dependent helicase Dna2
LQETGYAFGITCLGLTSSSLSTLFENEKMRFDYCIVDEASQIPEPLILKPMSLSRVILLVGDSYQLSPFNQSNDTRETGSLFERFSEVYGANVQLSFQYRMNRILQNLVNQFIYCGRMKSLEFSDSEELQFKSNFNSSSHPLPSLCIIDTSIMAKNVEISDPFTASFLNKAEAEIVLQLARNLIGEDMNIGVISPYRGQVSLLKEMISTCDLDFRSFVEINTIDQFQGRDKDIIIISSVRTSYAGDLLKDWKRVNVMLTRAKKKLIFVMKLTALTDSPFIRALADFIPSSAIIQVKCLEDITNMR